MVGRLGQLPIWVPRLCLGTGSSGNRGPSRQAQQSSQDYVRVLIKAYQHGLTFWDTADNYDTHRHIAKALETVPREQVVITTKVYSQSPQQLREDVHRCRAELHCDQIDILLLHEIDSLEEYRSKQACLDALHQLKEQGLLKAVGVSTHSIDVLESLVVDPKVEVVFTNYNIANQHMDANISDYTAALTTAHANGKGVYVHKTLNEGKLLDRYAEAIHFNLTRPFVHSVAVGVVTEPELEQLLRTSTDPNFSLTER